jgi:hypothetical protein
LVYNKHDARIELRVSTVGLPVAHMDETEFADFLQQVFAFVEKNNPGVKEASEKRWRAAWMSAIRKDRWKQKAEAAKEAFWRLLGKK